MSKKNRSEYLRRIPKVDALLASDGGRRLLQAYPHEVVVEGIRRGLEKVRHDIMRAERTEHITEETFSPSKILPLVEEEVARQVIPNLKRVINATGVVIHTNLGRSPLSERALRHVADASRGYSNLEYDLARGERGSRYSHVEEIILRLSAAEGGVAVNNNAGAVLLGLNTLAQGKEVICSRGELVEIGGGFRIPDVMSKSGAILKEVGTTNRTHLKDYEEAIGENTALLLKVHSSNYRVVGFTAEVTLEELVRLGRKHKLPVMNDLGSGCLIDLSAHGLAKEPTVQEAVRGGADVITFSGDKLLGGPQAGIIVGKRGFLERIRANPLSRALRIDKLTLAALEATLIAYLSEGEAVKEIPTLRMLTIPIEEIRTRAGRLQRLLKKEVNDAGIEVIGEMSQVGGGALPLQALPTWALAVKPAKTTVGALEEALRKLDLPIIARIANDRLILDLRTIQDKDFAAVCQGMALALKKAGGEG